MHINSVVASATAREAALVFSIQTGTADPALLQHLEQTRHELVGSQHEVEIWKGISACCEDPFAQLGIIAETLTRKVAELGGRSGADTLTFSERCASQQRDIFATYGLE